MYRITQVRPHAEGAKSGYALGLVTPGCVLATASVVTSLFGRAWAPAGLRAAQAELRPASCPAWPCVASCALPPATCAASWLSGARRPCGGHVPTWCCPRPTGSASWRNARRDQPWGQGPSVVSQQGLAWPAPKRLAGALGARATCGRLAPSPPPPLWPRRPRGAFPARLCLPRGPSPRSRPCSLPTEPSLA
jgi:hypothetical protein